MNIEFKKKTKLNSGGYSGGYSGNGEQGIPFTYNSAGDYVIDKSLHSYGDVVAHSDGGIDGSLTTTYLNDLGDVDLTGKQNGYVLTYNGVSTKWEPKLPTSGGGITEVHFSDIKGNVTDNVSIKLALENKSNINHTHTFEQLTSKPTTLAGYGITDAAGINGSFSHSFRASNFYAGSAFIRNLSGKVPGSGEEVDNLYINYLTNCHTILNAGSTHNVGIGLENPTDKLHVDGSIRATDRVYSTAEYTNNVYLNSISNSSYAAGIKFRNEGYAHITLGQKGSELVIADTGANGETMWTNPNDLFTINLAGDGKFNGDVIAYGMPTAVYSTKRSVTTLEEPVITDSPTAIDILIEKCERLERHNQYLTDEIIKLKQTLK